MQHLINECHELFVPEQLNCHRSERPLSENLEFCSVLDYTSVRFGEIFRYRVFQGFWHANL
jgi:hypothetical protein